METRLASAADIPRLAALHSESFGEARWDKTQISESLKLATTYALVAEENGIAQGFILCQITQDEAEILTFCVAPAARRKGIGQFLLQAATTHARQNTVKRLFLEVAADNQAALALYEKAGFSRIGSRKGYYQRGTEKIDAVMLEKTLN